MIIDHKSLDTMHYLLHTAHVGNIEVDTISIQTVKVTNPLTASGTSPARCMRADLMDWKISTTPSVFSRSSWEWTQMKVPVWPTPSLSVKSADRENKKNVQVKCDTDSCYDWLHFIGHCSETSSGLIIRPTFVAYNKQKSTIVLNNSNSKNLSQLEVY